MTTSPAPFAVGPVEITRASWLTLAVTSLVTFMVSMEITIIALAFPEIRAEFPEASESTLSWIITAYNIGVASLLLVAGWAADRYGRKRIFLIGLAIFAVGSAASGSAPSANWLISARVLQSIGGALQFPAGLALLLPAFPFEKRQMAIGVWGAMGGLAAALGPPIGGFLVDAFGWPAVFWINVPVAVFAVVAGRSWLVESKAEGVPAGVDLIGIPLASIGVGAIVLAIVQSESWGLVSARAVISTAIGLVMIFAFVRRSRTHPAPLFDLDLFGLRSFSVGNLGTVLFVIGFFAFFVPFPTFIQEAWGWSPAQTGAVLVPGPTIAFVLSPILGRVADRIGNGPILAVGGVSGVISMLLALVLIGEEPSVVDAIVPGLFLGVAAGCSFAMSVGAAMRDVPANRFGMAGAGRTTVFQLSIALSIALAVAVIGSADTPSERLAAGQRNWTLCLVAFGLQALIFTFFFPRGNPDAQAVAV